MIYTNLPDNMYKLPENAINVLSTILNKGDIDTIALTNTILYIIGLVIGLVLVLIMITFMVQSYIIPQHLGIAIGNVIGAIFMLVGLVHMFYEPYKIEKELTPLKKEYPMMFIAIYPQKYVLTTNYEVKKSNEIKDTDIIMNIDIDRLRKENIEVFTQIDLLKKWI